jgi:hypothetical protein
VEIATSQIQLRHSALALRQALGCVTRVSEAIEDGDVLFAQEILANLEIELLGALETAEAGS